MRRESLQIRLTREILDSLEVEAKAIGLSRAELAAVLIAEGLDERARRSESEVRHADGTMEKMGISNPSAA